MTTDYPAGGPGSTYNGFAAPGVPAPDPARRKKMMAQGVAVALALGLGLGALARPDLALHESRPMQAVAQTPTPKDQLQIVVAPAPPVKVPKATGTRLEVLPAEMAAAAPRAVYDSEPATIRWNTTIALNDEEVHVRPVVEEEAAQDSPIDCRRPSDREEARICSDIGFDRYADQGYD